LSNGCKAILTLDADGQHDPADIPNFLAAHQRDSQAILIGSRMAQADRFPTQRYYSNRTAAFFISKALGQYLEDTQCGFRLYPADTLRAIPLTTSHFQTETEVLLRAVQRGIRLGSVPVKNIYHLNGNAPRSNFRPVIDTFYICMVVLQSYLKLLN
jgi:GT2 family glycosyltransferase